MSKHLYFSIVFTIIFLLWTIGNLAAQDSSPLSDGEVFRLEITQPGVYKLDYNFFQSRLGQNPASLGKGAISLFGGKGAALPQETENIQDQMLQPISMKFVGFEDGSFDPSDYILTYLEGPYSWTYNTDKAMFTRQGNPYSNANYAFVVINSGQTPQEISLSDLRASSYAVDTYDDYQHYEEDRENILRESDGGAGYGSGQTWYGTRIRSSEAQNLISQFDLNDMIIGEPLRVDAEFAGRAGTVRNMSLQIGDTRVDKRVFSTVLSNVERLYANVISFQEEVLLDQAPTELSLGMSVRNGEEGYWVDYITIASRKKLRLDPLGQKVFHFEEGRDQQNIAADFGVTEDYFFWDISGPLQPMELFSNGSSVFLPTDNQAKTIIAFRESDALSLDDEVQAVANQNLATITSADYVIVSPSEFEPQAQRLLEHRRSFNNLSNPLVVDIQQIYNEYSSGKCDPTGLRNFLRQLYESDPEFNYVLLFGDATYDYRHINSEEPNDNFIPTYQTKNSIHPIEAFPSDDYYALLDVSEGNNLVGALDIAVGRLPIRTLSEARIMVDKIIAYDTDPNEVNGDWLNSITIVADDEDRNQHFTQAEQVSNIILSQSPKHNLDKIYLDALPQERSAQGVINLNARNNLYQNINRGQLIVNYIGHGSARSLASERVLRKEDIINWGNGDRLPLFVTATCSFAGFDDPSFVSAGEQTLLTEGGGSIALFTTVRLVYINHNGRLTRSVFNTIFEDEESQLLPIGEILRRSKNSNSRDTTATNARKFTLLGDPLLRLKSPTYQAHVSTINGTALSQDHIDTISAMEEVDLTGIITDRSGREMTDYNGQVDIKVFDKPTRLRTLGQDADSRVADFTIQNQLVYSGSVPVRDGLFSTSFVVPRDINYTPGRGKISLFASNDEGLLASGASEALYIGGTSADIIPDNQGPNISAFMDDSSFENGDAVLPNTLLVIHLEDDQGINIVGQGIGHEIEAIINGDNRNKIILNDFYNASFDDFKRGSIEFPFTDLEPGTYDLLIRAWDNHNNPSEISINFEVKELGAGDLIQNISNFPDPFTDETTFQFEQFTNLSQFNFWIEIFSHEGRLIQRTAFSESSGRSKVEGLNLTALGPDLVNLPSGMYLYRIVIETGGDESSDLPAEIVSETKKMIKIE